MIGVHFTSGAHGKRICSAQVSPVALLSGDPDGLLDADGAVFLVNDLDRDYMFAGTEFRQGIGSYRAVDSWSSLVIDPDMEMAPAWPRSHFIRQLMFLTRVDLRVIGW